MQHTRNERAFYGARESVSCPIPHTGHPEQSVDQVEEVTKPTGRIILYDNREREWIKLATLRLKLISEADWKGEHLNRQGCKVGSGQRSEKPRRMAIRSSDLDPQPKESDRTKKKNRTILMRHSAALDGHCDQIVQLKSSNHQYHVFHKNIAPARETGTAVRYCKE